MAILAEDPGGYLEPELNRSLYRAIIQASVIATAEGEPPPVVVPEGRNPPTLSDAEAAERESKIPDLYWAYIDDLAHDPSDAARQFVVECKRLAPSTGGRSFTREYVRLGIARYIEPAHGYGMGAASGAMVGYLQQIPISDAVAEVNGHAASDAIPPLEVSNRNEEESVALDHSFRRAFPESPFQLFHLWIRVEIRIERRGTR